MRRINVGFSAITAILMVVIVALAAAVAFLWLRYEDRGQETVVIASFEDCIEAGYPVMESYPRRCSVEGRTFTEEASNVPEFDTDTTGLIEHSSEKGAKVLIRDISDNDLISSPLDIRGEVAGSWSFEASFPIELRAPSGEVIANSVAELQDDWMTEENVPFIATLEFEVPEGLDNGQLVFVKDNPSGLSENDDEVAIPVRF